MSGVEGAATATTRYSSSPELSTPPRSPSDPGSPAARQLLNDHREAQVSNVAITFGVDAIQPPVKKKPGRKPKVPVDGSSATNTDAKPKRVRKPRDPNAPPVQRKKKAAQDAPPTNKAPAASRQTKITDVNMRQPEPGYPMLAEPFQMAQSGKHEDIHNPTPPSFFNAPPPQAAPVRTSGQNYDPIRSNYDPVRENAPHNSYNSQMSPKLAQVTNRASASPSISSLVDPPNHAATSPSLAAHSFFQHQMKMQNSSVPPSPTSNRIVPSPTPHTSHAPPPSAIQSATRVRHEEAPAPKPKQYVRAPPAFTANPAQITSIVKSSASSAAPTPKPHKPVDITPPPLPGQGNALFSGPKDGTESRAPTIVLHIPLNGGGNTYINFTKLAEERYGWDALHPRLAAQRERLARVAAAGAALEKSGGHHGGSGDEMSLDMSDAEGDGSNVEMGGMSDGRTGTDGGAPVKKVPKKRKMKEDDYDKDDGFVDDSDLLWEEQAAASVDGFFVYSGPLVPEGEKPTLERADGSGAGGAGGGTAKRTRGGARGGRGGGRAAAASTRGGATAAAGGPGSRGGGTTRKPRITKADRARRDAEKLEREKMGAMAGRGGYGGAGVGGMPMVFQEMVGGGGGA